jgi:hypothetical protein
MLEGNTTTDNGSHILVTYDGPPSYPQCIQELGPYSPYLGSTTKENVDYKGEKLLGVAPPFLTNVIRTL